MTAHVFRDLDQRSVSRKQSGRVQSARLIECHLPRTQAIRKVREHGSVDRPRDAQTKVVGRGAGTATKATGGKAAITDLVAAGDKVTVSFHDMGGTLHAAEVRVTAKGAK